jgi:hypothetical protein
MNVDPTFVLTEGSVTIPVTVNPAADVTPKLNVV